MPMSKLKSYDDDKKKIIFFFLSFDRYFSSSQRIQSQNKALHSLLLCTKVK